MPLRDGAKRRGPRLSTAGTNRTVASLVGILALLLTGGGWLYWKSRATSVPTDEVTLCPSKRPPTSVLVVLLDVSDRFTEAQQLAVANGFDRVLNTVPRFGLVEVYTVDQLRQRLQTPLLHICNPGTGSDLNQLYQNPDLAHRRWKAFSAKLADELSKDMQGEGLHASPILEAVQAVALRTFGAARYDGVQKRLLLVSDLLQNVPGEMNMYDRLPSFDEFAASPYYARVRASMDGVAVDIYYIDRGAVPTQGRKHIDFWDRYFRAQGATIESVERIFGAQ